MLRRVATMLMPALAMVAAGAHAQLATTVSTNAPGSYGGSLGLLNDDTYPPDTTQYRIDTVYDFPATTYFDFTFTGGLSSIGSFNVNVDNNDDYTISFYNGTMLITSRTILASDGVVSESRGGVETFSSSVLRSGTFLTNLTLLTPVQATFARVGAANGDGRYGIGEAAFFAALPGAVPEPAAWTMMILGFGLIGAFLRRRYIASEAAFTARVRAIAESGDS